MLKINLVPEVQQKKEAESRLNYLVTIISATVVIAVVAVIAIIGGLSVANSAMRHSAENRIADLQDRLIEFRPLQEAVLSLETGLKGAREVLDGKYIWTRLFAHLEKATPAEVKFTRLTISPTDIKASLESNNVDSLARFADSFKHYGIISLSGVADSEKVTVKIGDETTEITKGSDGKWFFSVPMDLNKDQEITIETGKTTTLKYSGKRGSLENPDPGIKFSSGPLFTNFNVSQYQKNGNVVTFEATMNFEGSLLW